MPSHRSSLNSHQSTWRPPPLQVVTGIRPLLCQLPLLTSSIVRGVICWTIRVQSAPVALYADGTFRSMSESYLSIIPHAQLVHAPRPRPRRRLQGSRCLDEERGPRRSASCLTMPINDACQPAACQTTTACQTTAAYKIAVQHLPPHVKARCGAPRRWAPWPQIQAAQMGAAVLLWAPGPVNVFDTLNNSLRLLTRTRSRPRNKEK